MNKAPYYKLDEAGEAVPCEDILEWAEWFAQHPEARVVVKTELPSGATVSTVFLGIDHGFHGGEPMLWETMTFGGDYDLACGSRRDAIIGHEMWVLVAKGEMTPIDARRLKAGFSTSTHGGQTHEKKKKDQA